MESKVSKNLNMNFLFALTVTVFTILGVANAKSGESYNGGSDGAPETSYAEHQRLRQDSDHRIAMTKIEKQNREFVLQNSRVSSIGALIFSSIAPGWPYPNPNNLAIRHGEKVQSEFESQIKKGKWPIKDVRVTSWSDDAATAILVTFKNNSYAQYSIDGNTLKFSSSLSQWANPTNVVAIGESQLDVYLGVITDSYPKRARTHLTFPLDSANRGNVLYSAIRDSDSDQKPFLEIVLRKPNGRVLANTYEINESAKNPFRLKESIEVAPKVFAMVDHIESPNSEKGSFCRYFYK